MLKRRGLFRLGALSALGMVGLAKASPLPTPSKWTKEYDVVIIGAGGAGLACAIETVDHNLSTLVLEKMPFVGGASAICGGQYSAANTPFQQKQGIKDDEEHFLKNMLDIGGHVNDPELIKAYIKESLIHFNWLADHGVHPSIVYAPSGMDIPRAHRFDPAEVINCMLAYVKGKESEIYGKSVILATGGFINNEYLLKRYKRYWSVLPSFIAGYGDTFNDRTGDGIMMGKKHGAALEDMESMAKFFSRPKVGTPAVSWLIVDVEPAYVVSKDGKRVTNENAARYSGICLDLIRNGYQYGHLILGSDTVGGKNEKRFRLQHAVENGGLFKGDTPEELAKQVGIDPKVLRETIDKINKDAAAGKDTEFGRTDPFFKPLKAPYYISAPAYIGIYKTEGGLEVNPNFQVLRYADDKPIPGLYAVGAGCGSITSRHSEVVASGLIAGEHAAKAAK